MKANVVNWQETRTIFENIGGEFVTPPEIIAQKLKEIKCFIFDWDGVFNMGLKARKDMSRFAEADAIGCNLLRFAWFYHLGEIPLIVIITSQRNEAAFYLAERDHFNAIYLDVPNKSKAIEHLCLTNKFEPNQLACYFDDILDFPMAALTGLRILVNHKSAPLARKYAIDDALCDYITSCDAQGFAIREGIEMMLGIQSWFQQTVKQYMAYDAPYRDYLALRNKIIPRYYLPGANEIVQVDSRTLL